MENQDVCSLSYLKNQQSAATKALTKNKKKIIEVYVFIDPICPECWAIEPYLKKLMLEYGEFIRLKFILTGKLTSLNTAKNTNQLAKKWELTASRSGMSCDGSLWLENPLKQPFLVSLAIKAAELQGRKAGAQFLRIIREHLFVGGTNVEDRNTLIACARKAKIDIDEFLKDIHSDVTAKALQCDFKISRDYQVTESPTLLFFNDQVEECGIKVTGVQDYSVYEEILFNLAKHPLVKANLPSLENFMELFRFIAVHEVATVYNYSYSDAKKQLNELKMKQFAREIPAKYGSFYRYVKENKK